MWAPFEAPIIWRSFLCSRFSTIGLDIAKSVFQVHGVDAAGQVVIRRQLRRRPAFFEKLPPCQMGIEACASSHHWSRELQRYRAYGAIDAPGLCEALILVGRDEPRSCSPLRSLTVVCLCQT